ncbi:MAG: response regulator transcription factor [Rhodospirillales bacterium]|nr:MAG: response regulator transcription factor [Rhodospirillales bacterium]
MQDVIDKEAPRSPSAASDRISLRSADRPVRVIVADNRRLCRECLRLLIETFDPGFEVAEADDPSQISGLVSAGPKVSVVLYNLVMAADDDVAFVHRVCREAPDVPLIVLCDDDDPAVMRRVMASGARAFLPSTTPSPVMIAVLRLVIAGGVYAPPHMVLEVPERPQPRSEHQPGEDQRKAVIATHFPQLTPRQRDVLTLLSQGFMNRDIARSLDMCENTVKAHVKQVMRKLGAANRTQAALMADRLVA